MERKKDPSGQAPRSRSPPARSLAAASPGGKPLFGQNVVAPANTQDESEASSSSATTSHRENPDTECSGSRQASGDDVASRKPHHGAGESGGGRSPGSAERDKRHRAKPASRSPLKSRLEGKADQGLAVGKVKRESMSVKAAGHRPEGHEAVGHEDSDKGVDRREDENASTVQNVDSANPQAARITDVPTQAARAKVLPFDDGITARMEETTALTEDALFLDTKTANATEEPSVSNEKAASLTTSVVVKSQDKETRLTVEETKYPTSAEGNEREKGQEVRVEEEEDPWGLPKVTNPQTSAECTTTARLLTYMTHAALLLCAVVLFYIMAAVADLYMSSLQLLGRRLVGWLLKHNDVLSSYIGCLAFGMLVSIFLQNPVFVVSLVMTLAYAEMLPVDLAPAMLMGVDLGASINNVLITFFVKGDEFRRALAVVASYDAFNWLNVLCFLPLEAATGVLYYTSLGMSAGIGGATGPHERPQTLEESPEMLPSTGPCEVINDDIFIEPIFFRKLTRPWTELLVQVRHSAIDPKQRGFNMSVSLLDTKGRHLLTGWAYSDEKAGLLLLVTSLLTLILLVVGFLRVVRRLMHTPVGLRVRHIINIYLPGGGHYMTGYVAMLPAVALGVLLDVSALLMVVVIILMGLGMFTLRRAFPIMVGLSTGRVVVVWVMSLSSILAWDCRRSNQVAVMLTLYRLLAILLWYAIPVLRQAPLHVGKTIGQTGHLYRCFVFTYLLGLFALTPALMFGVSFLPMAAEVALSVIFLLCIAFLVIVNVLQVKTKERLPWRLQSWSRMGVPRWMRSLQTLACAGRCVSIQVFSAKSFRLRRSQVASFVWKSFRRIHDSSPSGRTQPES